MALCHATLLAVSLWVYPRQRDVDTLAYQDLVYRGQFKAAVRAPLESRFTEGRPLVIVGSSNAWLAFRPSELSPLLPDFRVHNVSTGSLRMDEMRHLVQLAWHVMPAAQRARAVFVVPLIFSSFPTPHAYYSRRDEGVAREIAATGLFREIDGEYVPRGEGAALAAGSLLERPVAFVDALRDDVARWTFGVRRFLAEAFHRRVLDTALLWETRPPERFLFPAADTAEGRAINLSFFRGVMSGDTAPLGDGQFEELRRLCQWAAAHHVHLILVGMPVPGWVRDELPFFAVYEKKLAPVLREIAGNPTVRFVDLTDAPLPMWDATHPRPDGTRAWAEALAAALRTP